MHTVEMLIETLLLARFLPLKTFGTLMVLVSVTELIYGILDFRTGEAVVKFLPELEKKKGKRGTSDFLRHILLIDASVSALSLVIILFVSFFLFKWIHIPPQYTPLLIILGGGLALRGVVRSVGSYFRVSNLFPFSVKLGMISSLARFALILAAVLIAPGLTSVCWAFAISNSVFFLLSFSSLLFTFRRRGINPLSAPFHLEREERKSIIKFLFSINLSRTFKVLSTKLDVIFIAWLSSPAVVALYKVGARIASAVLLFSDPFTLAVYPEMSQLHSENKGHELKKILSSFSKFFASFSLVLIFCFSFFGKWIFRTLFGHLYADAHPVALVMLVGTSLAAVFFWIRPLLLVYGKADKLVIIWLVRITGQFTALFLLVPLMGAQGAGWAFTINYSLGIILSLFLLKRTEQSLIAKGVILRTEEHGI